MAEWPYRPAGGSRAEWEKIVGKQLGGASPATLDTMTPEGITLKALYTAEDTAHLSFTDTWPGIEPFVRGPQATKLAGLNDLVQVAKLGKERQDLPHHQEFSRLLRGGDHAR